MNSCSPEGQFCTGLRLTGVLLNSYITRTIKCTSIDFFTLQFLSFYYSAKFGNKSELYNPVNGRHNILKAKKQSLTSHRTYYVRTASNALHTLSHFSRTKAIRRNDSIPTVWMRQGGSSPEKQISQMHVRWKLNIVAGFLMLESMFLVIMKYFHISILSRDYYWEDGPLTSIIKIT